MTAATDWAITLVAGWLALRLVGATSSAAPMLLAGALGAMSLSALLGGVEHGFGVRIGERTRRLIWRVTLQLAVLASALLLAMAVVAHAPERWRTWLLAAVVLKALGFAHLAWWRLEFRWVVYDSLISFAGVAAAGGAAWVARDAASAPWMIAGVAVSVLAGVAQRAGVAPHRHFDHNDLYHVAQIAAAYLFYRGGLLIAG